MVHQLKLDLTDEVYYPLAQAAQSAGQSLEEWATVQLQSCASTSSHQTGNLKRLMAHAGAVDLGKSTGADNQSIDADLAREYGGCHQDGR